MRFIDFLLRSIELFSTPIGAESIKSPRAVKMTRRNRQKPLYAAVIALCLIWAVKISAQTRASDQFPDGPGKSAFIKVCTQCHDVDKVTGLRYSREEWQSLIDEMKAMGGDAADEEWKAVVEYLATNFPRE
jgi:cytochrome c5